MGLEFSEILNERIELNALRANHVMHQWNWEVFGLKPLCDQV